MGTATDFTLDEELHEVATNPVELREHVRHLEASLVDTMFPAVKVALLGELGVWYRILADLEKAEMFLREALRLVSEHGLDARFGIQQRIRLGTVLQWQRRFNQSNLLFSELLEECSGLPDGELYLAFALQHAGKNFFDQARYQDALDCFESAHEIRLALKAPADQIESTEFALTRTRARLGEGSGGGSGPDSSDGSDSGSDC